jgi:hypothetical protein
LNERKIFQRIKTIYIHLKNIQKCNFNLYFNISETFDPCSKSPADILFILDSSTSIGISNLEKEKNFVVKFVNDLDIGPIGVQASVGVFSDNAHAYFDLDTHLDKLELIKAIQRVSNTYGVYWNRVFLLSVCL